VFWWTIFGGAVLAAYLFLLETGRDRRSTGKATYPRQLRWLLLLTGPVGWAIWVATIAWQILRAVSADSGGTRNG